MTPRLLTTADLPQALVLSSSAGWNQTAADWHRLVDLAPDTCFGIGLDGSLAATSTLLPYGRRLAWLGMVLTRPDYQHRGLASRLVEHTLDKARELEIETLKLDATDQGQPIYEKLGFVAERRIERWTWNGTREVTQVATDAAGLSVPLELLAELDYRAFGADRMRLLRLLAVPGRSSAGAACPSKPVVTANGFALWGPGHIANYVGPCVAHTPDAAHSLIAGCLAQAAGPWMWDVLPDNPAGVELAKRFGFKPVRKLVRMRLGRSIPEHSELVYAAAGFELG